MWLSKDSSCRGTNLIALAHNTYCISLPNVFFPSFLLRTRACRAASVSASASGVIIVAIAVLSSVGTALASSRRSLASAFGNPSASVRIASSFCRRSLPAAVREAVANNRRRRRRLPHRQRQLLRRHRRADRRRRLPEPWPNLLVRTLPKWPPESRPKYKCKPTRISDPRSPIFTQNVEAPTIKKLKKKKTHALARPFRVFFHAIPFVTTAMCYVNLRSCHDPKL